MGNQRRLILGGERQGCLFNPLVAFNAPLYGAQPDRHFLFDAVPGKVDGGHQIQSAWSDAFLVQVGDVGYFRTIHELPRHGLPKFGRDGLVHAQILTR